MKTRLAASFGDKIDSRIKQISPVMVLVEVKFFGSGDLCKSSSVVEIIKNLDVLVACPAYVTKNLKYSRHTFFLSSFVGFLPF
jgi:hypothetical protein